MGEWVTLLSQRVRLGVRNVNTFLTPNFAFVSALFSSVSTLLNNIFKTWTPASAGVTSPVLVAAVCPPSTPSSQLHGRGRNALLTLTLLLPAFLSLTTPNAHAAAEPGQFVQWGAGARSLA